MKKKETIDDIICIWQGHDRPYPVNNKEEYKVRCEDCEGINKSCPYYHGMYRTRIYKVKNDNYKK